MERVLRDFGAEGRRDPVIHFYETFLAAYDPSLRDIRGVYYTPTPVVQYIVQSIDRLLVTKFGIPDGLADTSRVPESAGSAEVGNHKVLVLDPATGTSTFLYEVISLIRERVKNAGMTGAWPSYVREHLLPRLFGFEVMMAPYAVAHLKLGLQLAGQDLPPEERAAFAYDFAADDRARVYLTNTLDPGETRTNILLGEFISDEANAAAYVKTEKPIMVVLGNPPYQGQSMNTSERVQTDARGRKKKVRTFIGNLIDDYYSIKGVRLDEKNPKWLQDDYVKFIRFGQDRIDRTGHGVLAFVTNHTYLDAPTFRGMRASLLESFNDIYIIDLHGSTRRREKNPNGGTDENVFDQIQQGVCIAIFVKESDNPAPGVVHHHERWGTRDEKYEWLSTQNVATTDFTSVIPSAPFYGFHPEDSDIKAEWEASEPVKNMFPVSSTGVVTHRDGLVTDTDPARLRARISDFVNPSNSDADVRRRLFGTTQRTTSTGITYKAGDNRDWTLPEKRRALQSRPATEHDEAYQLIHYRPFDTRAIFYHRDVVDSLKRDVMQHMLDGPNVGLVTARSNKSQTQDQFLVSTMMTEVKTGEATTGSVLFPLWLYGDASLDAEAGSEGQLLTVADVRGSSRTPNLSKAIIDLLRTRLDLRLVDADYGDLSGTVGPRDLLNYVYAIGYSRTYRVRYANFLRRDYPHIPITSDLTLFKDLCAMGQRLIDLHTFESLDLASGPAFPAGGSGEIATAFPLWVPSGETPPDGGDAADVDRIYINRDGAQDATGQYFTGVDEEVWEYQIGGHKVLAKWFKARRGDRLSYDDVQHIRRMVVALSGTIAVQDEIEETIATWPIV